MKIIIKIQGWMWMRKALRRLQEQDYRLRYVPSLATVVKMAVLRQNAGKRQLTGMVAR